MKTDNRKFWQKKTEIGVMLLLLGIVMSFLPQTKEYCFEIIKIGGALATVGVVHRNIKDKKGE
jgi:predicted Kef-type K+ transport protein